MPLFSERSGLTKGRQALQLVLTATSQRNRL